MARPKPPDRAKILRQIERLEVALAKPSKDDPGALDNCTTHIRYWRLREAVASIDLSGADTPEEQKLRWLQVRQASEQCAAWEQRRDSAVRNQVLDRIDGLEKRIEAKQTAASKLTKIKT